MSREKAIKEIEFVITHLSPTQYLLVEALDRASKLLESKPEPEEFTKDARFQMNSGTLPITERYVNEDGHYYIPADIINLYFQACDRIDRLEAENKELALSEDEAAFQLGTLKSTLKSYQDMAKSHTEFYKAAREKLKQLQAENKALKGGD